MRVAKWATVAMAVAVLSVVIGASPSRAAGPAFTDAAATYKAKCVACHGAKAEKSFNASKSDDQLLNAVLKGVKPKMPSYEKSLGADAAKALVAHMKQLRN